MKCTVCNNPQCHDIELALLSRSHTLESLSRQYGPSVSALHRHRNHVKEKMIQARERLQRSQAQVSLLKLNAFLDHVQRGVEAAAADGDIDRVFKGSHIGSRLIHQINNLEVPLELDTVYRLISSPGFISQDSLLPTGPRIITDLHQAVLDTATAPCPDPPPELFTRDENKHDLVDAPEVTDAGSDGDADVGRASAAPPAILAAFSARLEALSLLQKHFPDLDFSTADIPRSSDAAPKTLREISAKLARKTSPSTEKVIQNQEDSQSEKNLPKNPRVGRESTRRAAKAQVPPAIWAIEAYPVDEEALLAPESLETADPWPPTPDHCISDPCLLETENRKPETENPKPSFSPPKHLPNRRREEDFRSNSVFGDLRKYF